MKLLVTKTLRKIKEWGGADFKQSRTSEIQTPMCVHEAKPGGGHSKQITCPSLAAESSRTSKGQLQAQQDFPTGPALAHLSGNSCSFPDIYSAGCTLDAPNLGLHEPPEQGVKAVLSGHVPQPWEKLEIPSLPLSHTCEPQLACTEHSSEGFLPLHTTNCRWAGQNGLHEQARLCPQPPLCQVQELSPPTLH